MNDDSENAPDQSEEAPELLGLFVEDSVIVERLIKSVQSRRRAQTEGRVGIVNELLTGTTPFPEERLRTAGLAGILRILHEEEPLGHLPQTESSFPEMIDRVLVQPLNTKFRAFLQRLFDAAATLHRAAACRCARAAA